jgi:hypothetical protein
VANVGVRFPDFSLYACLVNSDHFDELLISNPISESVWSNEGKKFEVLGGVHFDFGLVVADDGEYHTSSPAQVFFHHAALFPGGNKMHRSNKNHLRTPRNVR